MNYWSDDEKKRISELFAKATADIKQELDKINDLACESIFTPPLSDWEFVRMDMCKAMIKGLEDEVFPQIQIIGSVRSGDRLYISVYCNAFEKTHTYKMGIEGNFNLKLLIKQIHRIIPLLKSQNIRTKLNKINMETSQNKGSEITKVALGVLQDINPNFKMSSYGIVIELNLGEEISLRASATIESGPNPQIRMGISGEVPFPVLLEIVTYMNKLHECEVENDKTKDI